MRCCAMASHLIGDTDQTEGIRLSRYAGAFGRYLPKCFASLILPAFLAAGCTTLGPDFKEPEANVAKEWVEVDDAEITNQPAAHPEWWTVFNDPVLDELIETARSQNLTLRSAGLRVLQAHAQLGIAVGSKYPQVQQVSGSASRVEISENAADNIALLENSFAIYNLDFNLTWEIDFWGRFSRMIESAAAQLQANVAVYDTVMVALTAEVANAYVLTRTLEQRIELAEGNVRFQERALRIADVKFRNGAVTELDVQQARTVLNATQALIPVLQTSLRQTKNALGVLLGMVPRAVDGLLVASAPVPVPPAQISVGMPQDLIRRRPDIRQAEWVLAAQSAQIGVAITELYPHFSLGGSIGVATTDIGGKGIGDLFETGSVGGLLFGGFTWNVFNYGRLKNNIRFQDARFQELLVDYQNKVLTAQAEVDNAIVAYLRAQVRAKFLARSANAAERSVQLSLLQYREGATDFNSVLLTLTEQFDQQDALSETNGTIATNLITMYKALGGGWDVGGDRIVEDYVVEEDKQQLRTRTKYWRDTFPE
jgi:NodT family efflux transporter outer membrane factor (OMF) lipoprotein